MREQACDACGGEGRIPSEPCHECQGRGRRAVRKTLQVDVPPGIADEQRIRLSGRGHAGERGGPPGDLYVLVRVTEDERFLRDGNDLVTVVDVPAPAAALGTTVSVPTLDGDEEIDVPAGTQPGTVVTLRERGMPTHRSRPARRPAGGAERGDPAQPQCRARASCSRSCAPRSPPRTSRSRPTSRCSRRSGGRCADPPRVSGTAEMIRLAIRAPAEHAELVLAELLELAPAGFEQVDGDGFVEFALYGAAGELPTLPTGPADIAGVRVEVSGSEVGDDWADRWREFHRPVADRPALRASAVERAARRQHRHGHRSRPGVRHRRAPHDAALARAAAGGRAGGRSWISAAAPACSPSRRRSSASRRSPRSTTTRRPIEATLDNARCQRCDARARRASRPAHGARARGRRS